MLVVPFSFVFGHPSDGFEHDFHYHFQKPASESNAFGNPEIGCMWDMLFEDDARCKTR
jgi:hypothetical protein